MQRRQASLELHHAVQQPTAFERVRGYVLVVLRDDGKAGEERVAVMAVARCRIPAVRDFVPDLVGDEFVLRLERPIAVAALMAAMDPLHLLEKKNVGGEP